MKLSYFKIESKNFGDDLNEYIFPKLFPDLLSNSDDIDLYGIGTIIDKRIDASPRRVIFSSGIRDITYTPDRSKTDIRFVRGPFSAKILQCSYISDGAYCLHFLKEFEQYLNQEKSYEVSLIPYFRHMDLFDWNKISKMTGIHIINPCDTVDNVLREISKSKKIICGAMHGAIVADALRIPWTRLRLGDHGYESTLVSELKWHDWSMSIGINKIPTLFVNEFRRENKWLSRYLKVSTYIELFFVLKKHKSDDSIFTMSEDKVLDDLLHKLKIEVDLLNKTYNF